MLFESDAESVIVPGEEGQMTILGRHAPLLSTLTKGSVNVATGSGNKSFDITEGFIEVSEDSVTILAKQSPVSKDVTS